MTKDDFIERVQKPYKQVWTIVLLAQKAIKTQEDKDWELFAKEADRFEKEGLHIPFAELCSKFVYDAVDDLKEMNQGGEA